MSKHLNVTRRDLMKLAGATGLAAAAAPLASAIPAQAQSPTAVTNGNGFYRFKLGEFTVTVLSDGQTQSQNSPFPNWGANPGRQAEFEQILRDNFISLTPFVNNFTPMVVDTGKNKVLIDTGLGLASAQNGTGKLQAHLRNAGIRPETIDTVFITHGHGDHIQGLTNAQKRLLFPRAELVMGEAEFNLWAANPNPSAGLKQNVLDLKSRYKLVQADQEIVPGVRTLNSPGHTRGHLAVLVASGDKQLVHLGDAGGHFILSLKFPDHYLGFDADPSTATATRRAIFARAASEKMMVVGYHFPWPAVGYIRPDGNAFQYVPAFWVWG